MDPAVAIEVAALSRQKDMIETTALGDSDVQRFYKDSVVFLTGGSGFLGKQLIEKLLRSCQISKIFMLLRPKKGKHIHERLDDILKDPVFDMLRNQQPNFTDKIEIIPGDVSELGLGISYKDWQKITERITVIFHVAATTRFDEPLKVATLINVRGTREALTLGKSCKNLRSFVHVSTAYIYAKPETTGNKIYEKFYDAPVPPKTIISMVEQMDADRLVGITPQLIKGWPNTYTFTKVIAEELVRTTSTGLPISIVRPGVVISSHRVPLPGWMDLSCIYGASGIIVGVVLGLLHTMHTAVDKSIGFVPCDYVNNAIIAAGRETALNQANGGSDATIYNVSSTCRNPVTWSVIQETMETQRVPLESPAAVYYAYGIPTTKKWLFYILSLFLHLIPAYIADFVCLIMGKERRFAKTAKKVFKMCITLSYFMHSEWTFVDDNLDKLYSSLSKADKVIFNFDITDLTWPDYIVIWCIGCRKYLIKDGLKNTEYGNKKQKYFKFAHYILISLYVYGIWKVVNLMFYIVNSIFFC